MSSLRVAIEFLLPVRPAVPPVPEAPPGGHRAPHWFVPIGLVIGIVYALVFGGVWNVYGEYFGLRLLPAAVLLAADALFFGNRFIRGACSIADDVGGEPARGLRPAVLVFVLWLLVKFALLLALPKGQPWSPADWRRHFLFLYPSPVFRPLILMAIWGRWSALLALSLGRAQPGESAAFVDLMARTRLAVVLWWLVPVVVWTMLYCSLTKNAAAGLLVSGITLVAAYIAGVACSWRQGGQTKVSVWAVGAVGELAFLFAYVPFGSRIFGW